MGNFDLIYRRNSTSFARETPLYICLTYCTSDVFPAGDDAGAAGNCKCMRLGDPVSGTDYISEQMAAVDAAAAMAGHMVRITGTDKWLCHAAAGQ